LSQHAVVEKHLRQRWNKLRNWQLLPKKKTWNCLFFKTVVDSDFKPYKKIISERFWAILWKRIPFWSLQSAFESKAT
jgi:hypothetical protein